MLNQLHYFYNNEEMQMSAYRNNDQQERAEKAISYEKLLSKLNETLNSIRYELQDGVNRSRFLEKIAVFALLVPWLMIISFVWLPIRHELIMLLIPIGLLTVTCIFITWSIRRVKRKYRQFIGDSTAAIRSRAFRESCHRYNLTKREIEIIEWQREGLTHTKIGEKLFISPATVRKHVENIYSKADVHSKTELLYEMEFKYIK